MVRQLEQDSRPVNRLRKQGADDEYDGLEGYKRHYRNLVARYGAYPVVWILGGKEVSGKK